VGARWQRYWFAEGGRLAAACVRIALAVSVLVALRRLSYLHILVAPDALYRPVGPWMLLGGSPPAPWLVDVLWVCAWTGTLAMLVGFQTRIAVAVSFVAAMSRFWPGSSITSKSCHFGVAAMGGALGPRFASFNSV